MKGDQQRVRQGDTSRACVSDGPAIRLRPSLSTASDSILVALVGYTENGSIIGTGSNS